MTGEKFLQSFRHKKVLICRSAPMSFFRSLISRLSFLAGNENIFVLAQPSIQKEIETMNMSVWPIKEGSFRLDHFEERFLKKIKAACFDAIIIPVNNPEFVGYGEYLRLGMKGNIREIILIDREFRSRIYKGALAYLYFLEEAISRIKQGIGVTFATIRKGFFQLFARTIAVFFDFAGNLEPILRIRIGNLYTSRIGEMTHRLDLYLRRKKMEKKVFLDFQVMVSNSDLINESVANETILKITKRQFHFLSNPFLLTLYQEITRYKKSAVWMGMLPRDSYAYDIFHQAPSSLAFTEEEIQEGFRQLQDPGLDQRDSFVCFHARERGYLNRVFLNARKPYEDSPNDFRNCEIKNYLKAASYLTESGKYAIRMGQGAEKKISEENAKIIDYATKHRTDFLDIFLLAKCRFFLGCTAGPFGVARAFDVPAAGANWIPISEPPIRSEEMFIPKKMWHIAEKRFLSFQEMFEIDPDGSLKSQDYQNLGIEIIENTPEEILDLAREMELRLEGRWETTEEDGVLQERYRAIIPRHHKAYGFRSRMGAYFLRQNQALLENKKQKIKIS